MKTGRDRFGPVTYLVLAALMVFALFGTPGVQGGSDTGPQLGTLEIVSSPEAMVLIAPFEAAFVIAEGERILNAYFAEHELAEIAAMLESPAEHARYESGGRSGVGRRSNGLTSFYADLERIAGAPRAHPLRC